MRQRSEQRLVEAFVAQPPVEALDEGVLCRLAGRDIVPGDPPLGRPAQDRHAGQLRSVVRDAAERPGAAGDDGVQLAGDALPGDRGVGDQAEALPREVVDHRQDAEAPPIGQRVAQEVGDQR